MTSKKTNKRTNLFKAFQKETFQKTRSNNAINFNSFDKVKLDAKMGQNGNTMLFFICKSSIRHNNNFYHYENNIKNRQKNSVENCK